MRVLPFMQTLSSAAPLALNPVACAGAAVVEPAKVIALTKLIVFVDYAAVGAMRTVLPFYAKSLGAAATGVGALEALYGAGQIGGALLLGRMSDKRGRKAVLLASLLGSIIGYSMSGVAVGAGSATLLLLRRLPVGLAKQTVSASRAITSDVTSEAQRSDAISGLVGSMALGYALGPFLGGLLVDRVVNKQLPAYACAALFVALAPLIQFWLPETRPNTPPIPSPPTTTTTPLGASPSSAAPRAVESPTASSEPSSAATAMSAWRQPGLLLLLAACALPEAAVVSGSTALPLFAMQHLGWSASRLGLFTSVWCAAGTPPPLPSLARLLDLLSSRPVPCSSFPHSTASAPALPFPSPPAGQPARGAHSFSLTSAGGSLSASFPSGPSRPSFVRVG